jgi:Matrixin
MFLLLAVAPAITPHYFSAMAAYGKDQADDKDDDGDDDDGDNNSASEEDFEEQNSIQICCAWGRNLADAILTYFIDKEGSNKQQQHDVRNAVQEWDRNIDSLELEETSSKKNGDILIEFQREYERYANDDDEEQLVAGQSVNTFDNKGFIEKVHIIVYKGTSDYKFDDDTVERIVKHEMGHALGLGHANFGGNLMAEKVNDGTENISECEIKAVLQANHWKLMADDMQPDLPKRNGIVCNE